MEPTGVQYREGPITSLYEAANTGSTTIFETLDELILDKVTLSSFNETPLHISALLGHLDFTKVILKKCPTMALEQDSLKRLPLHLAAGKGHTQIVEALLETDKSSCLARDAEGRIPLHWAIIRGRADVIQQLVAANSMSFFEFLHGDTVFHLCVKHNHLEVLKRLVKLIDDHNIIKLGNQDSFEIINLGNQDGNTILHLAAMLKQLETLKYLLSRSERKAKLSSLNGKGLTTLDLSNKWDEFNDFLKEKGLTRCSWRYKLRKQLLVLFEYDLDDIRGALMIVATVVSTVSFQAAMNPPGGLWQEDSTDGTVSIVCNATHVCEAGTAILASTNPDMYALYILSNSFAFASSVSVIAVMVGGFSLKSKFILWFLALSIFGTVFFLSVSYISGVWSLNLSRNQQSIRPILVIPLFILEFVFVVVGIIYLARFVKWARRSDYWRKIKDKHWPRIKNKSVCCMDCDKGAQGSV